jgi:hypothetical protein
MMTDKKPLGRYSHSSTLVTIARKQYMVVFGGYDQDGSASHELFLCDVRCIAGEWEA